MKLYKISSYGQFINESKQSLHWASKYRLQLKEEIDSICKKYNIYNYTINEDETVDVDGNVLFYRSYFINGPKIPLIFGKVTGNFNCSDNQLTSLEGCPSKVGGNFYCSNNELTSLEGCPSEVGGSFHCNNNKLTSLEGCPNKVGSNFDCSYNKINDVKGFPKIIGGNIYISNNPVQEVFKLFPRDKWLEVIEFLNEYDVIRDGNKVVLQALELVYDELGLEVPDEINIEGYKII